MYVRFIVCMGGRVVVVETANNPRGRKSTVLTWPDAVRVTKVCQRLCQVLRRRARVREQHLRMQDGALAPVRCCP